MHLIKRIVKEVARAFALVMLIIVALNLYTLWYTRIITDVSAYVKVKSGRWSNSSLVAHFPKIIPREAKEPKFYFVPGYMQGVPTIELRIGMPGKFVEKKS